jgi:hypothetical protein
VPRPPCVRAATPHHRKLGAGYAALPQWLDATFGCDLCLPSGALAHAGWAVSPRGYRGLRALASLSLARSERRSARVLYSFVQKRRWFEHERELRAVIFDQPSKTLVNGKSAVDRETANLKEG